MSKTLSINDCMDVAYKRAKIRRDFTYNIVKKHTKKVLGENDFIIPVNWKMYLQSLDYSTINLEPNFEKSSFEKLNRSDPNSVDFSFVGGCGGKRSTYGKQSFDFSCIFEADYKKPILLPPSFVGGSVGKRCTYGKMEGQQNWSFRIRFTYIQEKSKDCLPYLLLFPPLPPTNEVATELACENVLQIFHHF